MARLEAAFPFRLLIPRPIYSALLAQAQQALPNECCGLLAGRRDGLWGRVERHYPLINARASPVEYEADPRSLLCAFRDMRQHGLVELAIYHSHPTAPPWPSRKDLERSYSPQVVCLIISLQGETPEVRGWWLETDSYREAAWEITDLPEPAAP
jgi:proteasome lid subunit RPN8/RPN11